jgi:beta-N-acetylhexosaminidase
MVGGYQEAGTISCLKHFPGHGDTAVDSHLALPIAPHNMQRLEEIELVPFKAGIAAGAPVVMTAHVAFPALTQQEDLPATLSYTVLTGLLREKLEFEGVIITDCLEMNAISKGVGIPRGAVMTLQAGADLVLISHIYKHQRAGFEAIRTLVKANELAPDIVRQAAERVLHLKERYLSWETLPGEQVPPLVGGGEHRLLRERVYDLSTTLVKNDEHIV